MSASRQFKMRASNDESAGSAWRPPWKDLDVRKGGTLDLRDPLGGPPRPSVDLGDPREAAAQGVVAHAVGYGIINGNGSSRRLAADTD